jgi:hypothetical protein
MRTFFCALLTGVALAVASCGARVPRQSPVAATAEDPLTAIVPGGALPWSATRRLTWSDFRARPPAGRTEAAVTATSLIWGFHCTGQTFTFQTVAVFLPDQSWVDPTVSIQLGSGMGTLRHEQTHFDLTEVFVRQMRQFFAALARPCDSTVQQLTDLGDRFVREESDAQRQYDKATANGRAASAQSRWDADVNRRLDTLAPYAAR